VTFAPSIPPPFKAHSPVLIEAQAKALGLPHDFVVLKAPYEQAYRDALASISQTSRAVVTGDIDLVSNCPNWIEQRAKGLNLEVIKPLWKESRQHIIDDLIDLKFDVVITAVNLTKAPRGRELLGQTLSKELVAKMKGLDPPIDLCGENGEYHTMVLNGPSFDRPISLTALKPREVQEGDLVYLDFS